MPLVDLLERFRRRWSPPGRVDSVAGVRDRGYGADVELREVFAAVDPFVEEAEQIVRQARVDADRRRSQAAETAANLTGEAPGHAATARSQAMASRRAEYEREIDRAREQAEREAGQLRALARQRLPQLVDRVTQTVLEAFPIGADRPDDRGDGRAR